MKKQSNMVYLPKKLKRKAKPKLSCQSNFATCMTYTILQFLFQLDTLQVDGVATIFLFRSPGDPMT